MADTKQTRASDEEKKALEAALSKLRDKYDDLKLRKRELERQRDFSEAEHERKQLQEMIDGIDADIQKVDTEYRATWQRRVDMILSKEYSSQCKDRLQHRLTDP
jgi:predicted nuclease with TOPRIM domain